MKQSQLPAVSTAPVPEHGLEFDNCLWAGSVGAFPSLGLCLASWSGRDSGYQRCFAESIGDWCWWLREGSIWNFRDRDAERSNNCRPACLLSLSSNFPLGETSLCFLLSILSSFLLYCFYSCPLHHITSMPQKASELHANQDTEFALNRVKAADAIQVSFLLR